MSRLAELTNLINDSLSGKVALFASAEQTKYTDQAVREAFFNILEDEKLTFQNFRNHKNEILTVFENVLNTNLPLAWENSPFYDQFVETSNELLGNKNEFVVETDGILFASRFSGNHWDTDRQKVQGRRSFSVPTEWIYVRIYDDFERFLLGSITLSDMVRKMQVAFQNEIDARVYSAFNGIGTFLPDKFKETGAYDKGLMNDLIQRVQIASQRNVIIAGTRTALADIADGIDTNWISSSQKEEMATKGMLIDNIGLPAKCMVIPQTFLRGTYDFKIQDKALFILPDNVKPIKLRFEGDTRARELGMTDTHDQTIDTQIQTKLGVSVVVDNLIAKYELV